MIITICLLILVYSILKRPVGGLLKKLEDVDWKKITQDAWKKIVTYSKKLGRATTRELLKFYYVMSEGDLSSFEKALVYAGIIYIAVPSDLLPRKVLGWLGVLDDVGVAAWIYDKIGNRITPAINLKVEMTLDDWFGPEIVAGVSID
ncbi:MAG: DUF1232 domain-containing protein [Candidatus Cryptobacteroides sp.]